MLPNIDPRLYGEFKQTYKKKRFRNSQVEQVADLVQLAYLDVNRRLGGIDEVQSQTFKEPVILAIEELLIRPPKNQEDFDTLHDRCCRQCLLAGSAGRADIYYGHAQKLLNMSLKYLYNEFAFYRGEGNRFNFPDNLEHLFHLPVDRQTRNYLVKTCRFTNPTPLPWSKWSDVHYMRFQFELRSRLINGYKALEIDYLLWNTEGASIGYAIRGC